VRRVFIGRRALQARNVSKAAINDVRVQVAEIEEEM
jgi:hypothetical protein